MQVLLFWVTVQVLLKMYFCSSFKGKLLNIFSRVEQLLEDWSQLSDLPPMSLAIHFMWKVSPLRCSIHSRCFWTVLYQYGFANMKLIKLCSKPKFFSSHIRFPTHVKKKKWGTKSGRKSKASKKRKKARKKRLLVGFSNFASKNSCE